MKYTPSLDGEFRVTLTARKRVTPDERRDLVALAKRRGQTLKEFLAFALEDGITRERELDEAESENQETK